jgi:hypothetical protein
MQRTDSDEFKSYGAKSEDDVDLLHDTTSLTRPIISVQERLFLIYLKNADRKRELVARINEIESIKKQKVMAKQLLMDKNRQHHLI